MSTSLHVCHCQVSNAVASSFDDHSTRSSTSFSHNSSLAVTFPEGAEGGGGMVSEWYPAVTSGKRVHEMLTPYTSHLYHSVKLGCT